MSEKLYKASDVIGILAEGVTDAEFLRVIKRLSNIPSAVVRCEDCIHNGSYDTDCPIDWNGKEYCSFSERRSE